MPPPSNTAVVVGLIATRVEATDGRISAKRLLPVARKAGYTGSPRNFRRAVAAAKATWKRDRRTYRPWVPVPRQHLVFDWAEEGGHNIFCAVLAWSRYRFVRFGADQTRSTTLELLAECFEELGGVPAVALTDRMACLRAGIVAKPSATGGLTPRELGVLVLAARGATTRAVATSLRIAPKTAGNHIERIYKKIGVSSRAEAAMFAMQHGLPATWEIQQA